MDGDQWRVYVKVVMDFYVSKNGGGRKVEFLE